MKHRIKLDAVSKGNSDIFFELQILARISAPEQYYAVGRMLKLTNELTQKYMEGKGKNKRVAEKFFRLLNELVLKDELAEVERLNKKIAESRKGLDDLARAVQLKGQMAMLSKRNFDLMLIETPEGIDPLDFKRRYFLESAELITDPEMYKEMLEHIEKVVNEAIQKR